MIIYMFTIRLVGAVCHMCPQVRCGDFFPPYSLFCDTAYVVVQVRRTSALSQVGYVRLFFNYTSLQQTERDGDLEMVPLPSANEGALPSIPAAFSFEIFIDSGC
ncbi:hypothetical protein XENORESO_021724 [Xenotaenia resolanae]|uniref:Secreted protein n=1 Tax=Xenotaenia resolanae TaxID=208358 RepID=A0ABV0WU40_9TELE